VEIPKKNIRFSRIPVYIDVYSGQEIFEEVRTSFIGPDPNQRKDRK